jgi:hypothetical protein
MNKTSKVMLSIAIVTLVWMTASPLLAAAASSPTVTGKLDIQFNSRVQTDSSGIDNCAG